MTDIEVPAAPEKFKTTETQRAYASGYQAGLRRQLATIRRLQGEVNALRKNAPTNLKPQRSILSPQNYRMPAGPHNLRSMGDGWHMFRTVLPTLADCRGGKVEVVGLEGTSRMSIHDWCPDAATWEANGFHWWRTPRVV